nr:LuxR C-terminal-related transcriptional regulator [Hyphobacterium sp. CCMP332]
MRSPNLSPRQLAVLKMLGEGATNKAIAEALNISENTVKSHLRSIFEGLGVRTRTACGHKVVLLGLIQFACRRSRARSRAARSVSLSAGFGMIVTSSRSAALAKSQTSPVSRPPGATHSSCGASGRYTALLDLPANDNDTLLLLIAGQNGGWRLER